jgi:hypothetical protein
MIYEEVQRFSLSLLLGIGLFVIVLAGIVAVFAVKTDRLTTFAMITATLLPIFALYFLFRLETRVSANELTVRLFPMASRSIPKSEISTSAVVQYRALRDFGGWGIRYGRGGKMYNARGNQAVKLALKSGETVYIGTERPAELLKALEGR